MCKEQGNRAAHLSDEVAGDIGNAAGVLRFLEETAGNYGTRLATPACTGENGYSVEGWAGMSLVLASVRQGLENIIADPEGSETRRQA